LPFSTFTGGRRDVAWPVLCTLSGAGITELGGEIGSASISGGCEEDGIASFPEAGAFVDGVDCWLSAGFCERADDLGLSLDVEIDVDKL
jgi:hypothetical protein